MVIPRPLGQKPSQSPAASQNRLQRQDQAHKPGLKRITDERCMIHLEY